MKKYARLIIYLLTCIQVSPILAQVPGIAWQLELGGNSEDGLQTVRQTPDGGYIVGGFSKSDISGIKTEDSRGSYDYWILKLDSIGTIEWQKTYGGDLDDFLKNAEPTIDGGYILGGVSISNLSGDKTEPSWYSVWDENTFDYWVIKVDSIGNIEWQNTIGSEGDESFAAIKQTIDNGFIIGGYTYGVGGDKTEGIYGATDFWLVKLDASGEIEWQHDIGGNSWDDLFDLALTDDGGFLLGGKSASGIEYDITEDAYGNDFFVMKIDSSGEIEWQNMIMGNGYQEEIYSLNPTSDGGVIIGGPSNSGFFGDKTEPCYGGTVDGTDYWILKLDETGIIEWQNTIGGNGDDNLFSLLETSENDYVMSGTSNSDTCADKNEEPLGYDFWVIKLNNSGSIKWEMTYGGDFSDGAHSIIQTDDGGYIIGGSSGSGISGNKTVANFGGSDYWLVKLYCDSSKFYADLDGDAYGDATNFIIECMKPAGYTSDSTDCDDSNPYVFPGAVEILNEIDDNCNGLTDEGLVEISNLQTKFSFYPNPVSDYIRIECSNNENYDFPLHINLYNYSNEKILSAEITECPAFINTKNLIQGFYFIQVVDNKGQLTNTCFVKF